MLLAFIYHITSLPVNCTCMWQCNQMAPSILEPTLQCSSSPMGAFPSLPSRVGDWQGGKAESKALCQPLRYGAQRRQSRSPWAAAVPGCEEGAPSLAPVPPTGGSACPNSPLQLGQQENDLATSLILRWSTLHSTFGKTTGGKQTDTRRMESNIQGIRAAQYLFETNTNFFIWYIISS